MFGLSYAVGSVMDRYFIAKAVGRTLSAEEIRSAWKQARKAGEQEGKRREEHIRGNARKD